MAAHDQLLDRSVVIAVCEGTSAQRSEFTRQSQAVARLKSKFLVDIYDCGFYDGRPFVVFERPSHNLNEMTGTDLYEGVPRVSGEDLARELEEAVACLRVAGIEVRDVPPDAIGVDEAGHVRLSPWFLGSVCAATETSASGVALSDVAGKVAPSDVATIELTHGGTTWQQPNQEGGTTTILPATGRAPVADRAFAAERSPDAATAQVAIDRTVLSRPRISSQMAKRRPRSRYLVAAAALTVAIAAAGTIGSLLGQASTPAPRQDSPSATAGSNPSTSTRPPSAMGTSMGSPAGVQPARNQSTSQPVPPAATTPTAALAIPTGNTNTPTPGVVGATGSPTASTTTTTTIPATSTTVPIATTTTTAPASSTTTTTTTPAPPSP